MADKPERFSPEQREQIKRALKWALRPQTWRKTEQGTQIRDWFERKLNGLAAYGMADKSQLPEYAVDMVRLHYSEGLTITYLASWYHVSESSVKRRIAQVLDAVVDQAPMSLLVGLTKLPFTWQENGCPHCGCDQYWDSEGACGREGEWVGLLCSRRYSQEGLLLG